MIPPLSLSLSLYKELSNKLFKVQNMRQEH